MARNQIVLSDSSGSQTVKFTTRDAKVISMFHRLPFFKMILGSGGKPASYERTRLLAETKKFLTVIQRELPLLEYHYAHQFTNAPAKIARGTKRVSGFQIEGKYFTVRAGFGECFLRQMRPRAKQVDIRRKSKIQTDNWGDLRILRRRQKLTLIDRLQGMIECLRKSSDKKITLRSAAHWETAD